ncbi:hypothetical protein HBB16_18290 [Pseudonocardia sp. MCCB 268]|nr:hypothetical protein [Pseudonocardia cytotoxica]
MHRHIGGSTAPTCRAWPESDRGVAATAALARRRHRQHRAAPGSGIVTRLSGMVGEALRTVRLAQKLSQLPTASATGPASSSCGSVRAGGRGAAARARRRRRPDGGGRCVREGAGTAGTACRCCCSSGPRCRRASVEMLKPGRRTCAPSGCAVSAIMTRSRRLQPTAAIVLYCTMAALRAHQRGHGYAARTPACCS